MKMSTEASNPKPASADLYVATANLPRVPKAKKMGLVPNGSVRKATVSVRKSTMTIANSPSNLLAIFAAPHFL